MEIYQLSHENMQQVATHVYCSVLEGLRNTGHLSAEQAEELAENYMVCYVRKKGLLKRLRDRLFERESRADYEFTLVRVIVPKWRNGSREG